MKIQKECIPCLIKRIVFETDESTTDKQLKENTVKQAMKVFSDEFSFDKCSADIATKVHKITYKTLHDLDPYKKLKKASNAIALSLVPEIESIIAKSDDTFKMSMLCAIIGNSLDFGIEGGSKNPEIFSKKFHQLINEGLGYDDTDEVKKLLTTSKNILYFTDNCGEIVFDKILCREIKKKYPHIHLTLVVKGEHVLSDATMEDVTFIDFKEVVDNVLTTGVFAVGFDLNHIPKDLQTALDASDLIISKGMANFEVFSETTYKPIAYLMRTKCEPIARSLGVPVHINAVKVID